MAQIVAVTSVLPPRKVALDDLGNVVYFGQARLAANTGDAVWQIRRITTVGGLTTIEWADGNDRYDNVWNNRASLSYS